MSFTMMPLARRVTIQPFRPRIVHFRAPKASFRLNTPGILHSNPLPEHENVLILGSKA